MNFKIKLSNKNDTVLRLPISQAIIIKDQFDD